jgi:hypothetical protein
MAMTRDAEIEAEARFVLRETIMHSGWYPSLPDADRCRRIEQDVDLHWHLMVNHAVKRLDERLRTAQK